LNPRGCCVPILVSPTTPAQLNKSLLPQECEHTQKVGKMNDMLLA